MVKSILILFLFSILLFSCEKDDERLMISGEITNLVNPYFLASFRVSDSVAVDTIHVDEKGKFSYFQNIDTTTMFTFYFNDFHSSTVVFTEKGVKKIKLKGDAILPDLIEIKGGEINDNLSVFKKENEAILKQRSLLLAQTNDEADSSIKTINIISEKEQLALMNSLNHELAQKVEDFIIEHPDKISSVILINEFFKNNENPKTFDRVLGYLKGDALNFPLTSKLQKYNEKLMLSSEGADMPYFQLTDVNDKTVRSNDFRDKYLLISFLSSNGEKSKENLEILKDEYHQLDKKNIEFLSIYIDSDTFPIVYHEIDSIPWKIVTADKSWGSDIVDAYNVHYVPFNILIDPKGKIVSRDIPVGDVRNLINSENDKSNL
ncbi:MAG: thioredoxin-like domain-containing protein [Dysgonamonadaceae bacterium]|nr:DUF4369 domain-containing protein [Dysgonamonadaceae bacterium]MDD3727160.1 DUF4369 domain-containing protein [Dysgonamonadaceae bacterium]MDD4605683.1 DUF4369 domain-containing protein [Dysgonamonadaceae bacterium]